MLSVVVFFQGHQKGFGRWRKVDWDQQRRIRSLLNLLTRFSRLFKVFFLFIVRIFDSDNHEKFSISSIEKRNLKCKNRTRLYVMTDSSRHVRRETADEREQSPLNTEFVVQWLRPIIIDAYLFRTLTHLISFPSGEFCDVCQQKNLGILLFFWERCGPVTAEKCDQVD